MDKLLSLISKIQSYKVLPEPQYRAVGEHLLPIAASILEELNKYKEDIQHEEQSKFYKMIDKMATENSFLQIEIPTKGTVELSVKFIPKK
jgi:hypothetical protein